MSTQWEVVGKSKKQKAGEIKKLNKLEEQQNFLEKAPKMIESLPINDVETLFATFDRSGNKENTKTTNQEKTKKHSSPQQKNIKPNPNTINKKPTAPTMNSKPKPKNLETALNSINVLELQTLLANRKVLFPDSPIIWLQTISAFLNSNLFVEVDPIFSGRPFNYPSNIIPEDLYELIQNQLSNTNTINLQYFYDQALTAMVVDMSKNQAFIGHKIMLQLVAILYPTVCCNSLAKYVILRNSYQNNINVCLSLFWSLGQGGYYDINAGVRVWQNIMSPVLKLKSYTRFVSEYINKILKIHQNDKTSKLNITFDELLVTYYLLSDPFYGYNSNYVKMLNDSASMIVLKYVKSLTNRSLIFISLLETLSEYNSIFINSLFECLIMEDYKDCINAWKNNYENNIINSFYLLIYIDKNVHKLPIGYEKNDEFIDLMKLVKGIHKELLNNKDIKEELQQANVAYENIQEKLQMGKKNKNKNSSSSSSRLPWIFASFLVIGAVTGLLLFDVEQNGGGKFEKSATGKFLDNVGALPYVQKGWTVTMSYSARGYKWAEANLPVYYINAMKVLTPYCEFLKDFGKIMCNVSCSVWDNIKNLIRQKTPVVAGFIEPYAPGLPSKIQDISIKTWNTLSTVSIDTYKTGCEFFKTKIFVGQLSPENLNQALNRTQHYVINYFRWFHNQIDAYAKLK